MPPIPKDTSLMNHIALRQHTEVRRPYLGMSEAGKSCARYLWYCLHWAFDSTYNDNVKRLFERGQLEEERVVRTLAEVGVEVTKRQAEVKAVNGYVEGHCDGVALGVLGYEHIEHLLEIKTHNDRSFKELQNKNVHNSKPTHYAQMQLYMHHMELKWALYYAVNKNTDEIYTERVHYDESFCELLLERLEAIVMQEIPPPRIGDYDYYLCRMCNAKGICHFEDSMSVNCRTCVQCDMYDNNVWKCANEGRAEFYSPELSVSQQRTGCLQHKVISNE